MNVTELRALQAPFKDRYRADPATALVTMRAEGDLDPATITCCIAKGHGSAINAGLHPLAGGPETAVCAAEMLLQSLVACSGVTLMAVATAMEIDLRGGRIVVEGDLDFRGTLGVARDVPVGFTEIRVHCELQTTATPEQMQKLTQLTERYCVVWQTLQKPPHLTATVASFSPS